MNSLSELEVQYEGFTSRLDILMYYVAVSNNTEANHTSCKEYVSRLCYHFIVAKKKKTVNINFKLHVFASFTNSVLYWVYIYVVHIFTLCFFSSSYIAHMIGH